MESGVGGCACKCVNVAYKCFGGRRFGLLFTRCWEDSTITITFIEGRNENLVNDAEMFLVTDEKKIPTFKQFRVKAS